MRLIELPVRPLLTRWSLNLALSSDV